MRDVLSVWWATVLASGLIASDTFAADLKEQSDTQRDPPVDRSRGPVLPRPGSGAVPPAPSLPANPPGVSLVPKVTTPASPPRAVFPYYNSQGYTPYMPYGVGTDVYGYSYSYPYDYGAYYPYGYIPPLVVPAETMYGPGVMRRFLGVGEGNTAGGGFRQRDEDVPPRSTNVEATALGWKFIGYGDEHFRNERYSEAYQRYRKAATAAPALADVYFRQGFALIAMGRYDAAVQAFKRGLTLEPKWATSRFRVDDLYAANRGSKMGHVSALADAATDDPNNGDLLFLVGVELYFDGQKDRAKPFFQRADALSRGNHAHLKGFLDPAN